MSDCATRRAQNAERQKRWRKRQRRHEIALVIEVDEHSFARLLIALEFVSEEESEDRAVLAEGAKRWIRERIEKDMPPAPSRSRFGR